MKTLKTIFGLLLAALVLLLFASCASSKPAAPQEEILPPETGTEVKLHFYDVPNIKSWGDCTFIEFPNGQTMLIDAGTQEAGRKICLDLLSKGIKEIDYLIISHYHKDHVNGLKEILPLIKVHKAYTTGYYPTDFEWTDPFVKQYVDKLIYVSSGYKLDIGSVHFDFLWPDDGDIRVLPTGPSSATDGMSGCNKDINNHSMLIRMIYKENSVLFASDICAAEEEIVAKYIADPGILDCDILKIPHHGYNTSSSDAFVKAVSPKYAFSMGTAVMDTSVFTRYYKLGCSVFMSWQNGNAYVTLDGQNITVTTDKTGYAPAYAAYVEASQRLDHTETQAAAPAATADAVTVKVSTWDELRTQILSAKKDTVIEITGDLVADRTIQISSAFPITLTDDGKAHTISRGDLKSACFKVAEGSTFTIGATAEGNLVLDGKKTDATEAFISTAGLTTLQNLIMKDCRNTAGEGGAVNVEKGILTAKKSTFENNYASAGAAIATVTKMVSITDIDSCTFTGNVARTNGGALNIMNSNVLFMSNSTLSGNRTESTAKNKGGAAMYMAVTNSTVSGCTFENNTVSGVDDGSLTGGAILYYCVGSSDTENKISDCTFRGNGGVDFGGAIGIGDNGKTRTKTGIITVSGCTFESDSAAHGSGLGARYSNEMVGVTLTVNGCTFTSDTAYAPDDTRLTWTDNNTDISAK